MVICSVGETGVHDRYTDSVTVLDQSGSGEDSLTDTNLLKDCKNVFLFNCTFWFSSYRPLKVKGKHYISTGSKKLRTSNFLENGVKLFKSPLRKRIVCTLSDAQVSKYNIIRYELAMRN